MTGIAGQAAKKGPLLYRLAPLAILVAGLVAFFAFDLDRFIGLDALQEHRDWLADQVEALLRAGR